MNLLLERSLAFYWGTSEWSAVQLQQATHCAQRLGLVGPVMEQCEYSMLKRERVEVEYAYAGLYPQLGITTWGPLSSGLLTGKYAQQMPLDSRFAYGLRSAAAGAQQRATADLQGKSAAALRLAPLARELDCSLAQLAIAWCLTNMHVSTVI